MTTTPNIDVEDVGKALREGRPLRPARAYQIQYAQDDLNFRSIEISDPIPLGRQILAAAGISADEEHSLFAILPTGDFEDLRLDEPFDLRGRGAERFVGFRTDRDYKLTLNGDQLAWGKPAITGAALYSLANVGLDEAVFLEVRGGTDRLVEPGDLVDLNAPGIERFITGPKPKATFEIIVNSRPKVVENQRVTFEQVVQLAFPSTADPNVAFSMTYQHAESKPHTGELGAGGSVDVKKKGTVFNVTKTVRS